MICSTTDKSNIMADIRFALSDKYEGMRII